MLKSWLQDAPYLQNFPTIAEKPGVNPHVIRRLQLQGSYDGGVSLITNSSEIKGLIHTMSAYVALSLTKVLMAYCLAI